MSFSKEALIIIHAAIQLDRTKIILEKLHEKRISCQRELLREGVKLVSLHQEGGEPSKIQLAMDERLLLLIKSQRIEIAIEKFEKAKESFLAIVNAASES